MTGVAASQPARIAVRIIAEIVDKPQLRLVLRSTLLASPSMSPKLLVLVLVLASGFALPVLLSSLSSSASSSYSSQEVSSDKPRRLLQFVKFPSIFEVPFEMHIRLVLLMQATFPLVLAGRTEWLAGCIACSWAVWVRGACSAMPRRRFSLCFSSRLPMLRSTMWKG